MKICFVSAYPPNKGNLAEYGCYLVNELIKHKSIDEIIVLADYNPNSYQIEKIGKLKILRCWRRNSFLIPVTIIKALRKENPDIVHFNLHMMSWGKSKISNFLGALTPYLVKMLLRKKVVVTLHNIVDAVDLKELGIKNNPLIIFGARLATKALLSADKVIVTLGRFRRILEQQYKKKNIIRIPHGTLGRKVKKLRVGGKKLLTFGFWRENKNLPLLIEVFKKVHKEDKRIKLIIAGTSHPSFPGYLDKLKEKYKEVKGITFTGYVPEEKLSKLFLSSTFLVLPYTTATGTSGVIHLAASYGKPVIISDLPEIRETAKEEKLKLILVPKNDERALANAIKNLLKNKKLQKRIAEKNLISAEKYSFTNVAKQYIEIFNQLLYIKS
jgi:glycosyltransferase involved in cell wall biosynthesis